MSEPCHSCGGPMEVTLGPGRFAQYRGVRCEVPADLPIRTCQACGAEWMNGDEITVLSEAFEAQRLKAKRYTAQEIRAAVEQDRERLWAPWALGRPQGWTCDARTRDIVCLSYWLREELERIGIDELGRKTQEAEFHRYSRSDLDLWELAADIMQKTLAGQIDRGRATHHRWG